MAGLALLNALGSSFCFGRYAETGDPPTLGVAVFGALFVIWASGQED